MNSLLVGLWWFMEDARAVVVVVVVVQRRALLQSNIQQSGLGFIGAHRGASALFLLPLRRVSVLFLALAATNHQAAHSLCLSHGFSNIPGLIWATTGNLRQAPANRSVQPKNHEGLASFTVTGACRGACTWAARRTVFFLRQKPDKFAGWMTFWVEKREFNA